jgi:hypothetical protein
MYAMLGTRPDLAFTVSTLSKYCSNPTPEHALAAQRTLRYLRKTINAGITYGGQENPAIQEAIGGPITIGITGFTDSDWAGDKDSRKSTSGYVFLLHGGAVSWKSTKQNVVATSSTEAEYIACSEAAKEALWIRRLDTEIKGTATPLVQDRYQHENDILDQIRALRITTPNTTTPTPQGNPQIILADNQGAIKLSKNPQHHSRSKHIDVKYHFIRNSYQNGLIELAYIPTAEMVADILTKALPREKHEKHMKGMGMSQWAMSLN